jgi:hypothetical protein
MYIKDRTNLGGVQTTANNAPTVADTEIINAPSVYTTTLGTWVAFRAACPGKTVITINAVQITASPMTAWCANVSGGGSPVVTTTGGGQNSVVWFVSTEGETVTPDYKLHGFDGDTGMPVVTTAAMLSSHRFISPIAAKARMYVATDTKLYSFITQ